MEGAEDALFECCKGSLNAIRDDGGEKKKEQICNDLTMIKKSCFSRVARAFFIFF